MPGLFICASCEVLPGGMPVQEKGAFEGEGGEAKRMPRDKFEVEEELRLEREARALRDGGGGEKEEL